MAKLDGKIALIPGGTGGVGEGIVRGFLNAGATVVVPSRREESLEKLRRQLGESAGDRFVPLVGERLKQRCPTTVRSVFQRRDNSCSRRY